MPVPANDQTGVVTDNAQALAVEIDISIERDRIRTEFLSALNEFSRQGLSGLELASAVLERLRGLSDKTVERAARGAASESFNLGRNLEAQVRQEDIREAVRSEVFDINTCEPCEDLDGVVVRVNGPVVKASGKARRRMSELGIDPRSDDAYHQLMPPSACDGRVQCRGIMIYRRAA